MTMEGTLKMSDARLAEQVWKFKSVDRRLERIFEGGEAYEIW